MKMKKIKKQKKEARKRSRTYLHNPLHDEHIHTTFSRLSHISRERKIEYEGMTPKIVYWTSLIVLLVCNFVMSVTLIPFILVLSGFKFYLLVALLGFVFGFLFNIIINDIEHIEAKHHVFAVVFIPFVAIINIWIMVGVSNKIASMLNILKYEDPLLPGMLYTIVFILPYAFSMVRKGEKEHKIHQEI